ncbi:MAG: putative DNA binding domain-containing protein, partial [Nanoarchaeota archaeon]|nr:putative DNA binding domain-containing protein [Nanoarchaeota archaeon]
MNEKELKFILQEGEGLKIEFKESFDKFLAKEMVAFANSEGGRIFLGVNDNGIVKGIAITNRVKSQIQDIARNCDPSIKIDLEEFNKVLIINVEEEKDKPYKCSSGFYLRQGANSQKLSRNEIIDFSISEGKIRFDEQINNEFEFPNDFDGEKLNNYLSLAKISKIISNEKIFAELNIIKKDKPLKFNNAGVLFFAKEPQRFISHSVFTCVSFKNKEGSDIIDRQEITGNL